MAIEFLKELDPKKVEAWDRIHDKRKLYRCERCGAEWKCEYHKNKFGSKHEINGDPDILCQCCGFPVMGIPYPVMYCPCCKVKHVSGDVVTEEQLKDIIERLESNEE